MKIVGLASILMMLGSGHVSASNYWSNAFSDESKGVFEYTERTSRGLPKGTYTPHHPEPLWKRVGVFAPSRRVVKVSLIACTIPAYFWLKKQFSTP